MSKLISPFRLRRLLPSRHRMRRAGTSIRGRRLLRRRNGLRKDRLHAADQLIRQQLLDDGLVVVRVEGSLARIPLEEVEDDGVIHVPTDAIVDASWLRLRQSRRLGIYFF
jgi:hypothetical protein